MEADSLLEPDAGHTRSMARLQKAGLCGCPDPQYGKEILGLKTTQTIDPERNAKA
jgi:hypothetical protein